MGRDAMDIAYYHLESYYLIVMMMMMMMIIIINIRKISSI